MVDSVTIGLGVVAAVGGAALLGWTYSAWYIVAKCEKPKYEVIKKLGYGKGIPYFRPQLEIRKYAPYIVAEATVEAADKAEASRRGFMLLAGYIFGKNEGQSGSTKAGVKTSSDDNPFSGPGTKIAMTSPVVTQMPEFDGTKIPMTSPVVTQPLVAGRYTIQFMMPSKYSMADLPKPLDSRVQFVQVPAQTLAVVRVRGNYPNERRIAVLRTLLEERAAEEKIGLGEGLQVFQYDPPFSPFFLKRCEVLLPVAA